MFWKPLDLFYVCYLVTSKLWQYANLVRLKDSIDALQYNGKQVLPVAGARDMLCWVTV